jgi:hypothetical protein
MQKLIAIDAPNAGIDWPMKIFTLNDSPKVLIAAKRDSTTKSTNVNRPTIASNTFERWLYNKVFRLELLLPKFTLPRALDTPNKSPNRTPQIIGTITVVSMLSLFAYNI